jgi:hypothetical protein
LGGGHQRNRSQPLLSHPQGNKLDEAARNNRATNGFPGDPKKPRETKTKNNKTKQMHTTKTKLAFRAATKLAGGLMTLAAGFLAGNVAHAHISYSGRDFGAYSGLTNGTKVITNQTVTGNYGWADAADGVLGDSHRGRAFRFHLDNPALVSLTVSANPSATTNSLGGLTPAFSIYSGLAAIAPYAVGWTNLPVSADHDFGPASVAWRIWWVQQNIDTNATSEAPTDGSWNALGDWAIGGDGDLPGDFAQLSSFTYKSSAASTNSGGPVTGSFALPAGDFTVFIGGNDIANKTSGTALSPYGISATFAVTPAPVLSIAQKVFVAWPSDTATNWVIESASAMNATHWTTVTNIPVVVDGQPGVVLESSAILQFFRFNYIP